jgi:carbon-monoxide dehydrogenase medium subunit
MKTASFQLHKPATIEEAVKLLARYVDDDVAVLAGGQSLVPSMMFRMAVPGHLVDINEIPALATLEVNDDHLLIGAGVRHARFEEAVEPGPTGRLLSEIASFIAHHPIRTRGTFCGSLAQSDPSSEWCMASATLGATVIVEGSGGRREIPIEDYFRGIMDTAREAEELIVAVRLPLLPADSVAGFIEFSRRLGDYAMAMALATWRMVNGVITDARLGIGGAEAHPRRIAEAEALLNGKTPSREIFAEAAEIAAGAIDPLEDVQADAAYRRDLVRAMAKRAMEKCVR